LRRKLLAWYDRNKRDLPWRQRAKDVYAQWVAEIMLQQTRVETVIPYYERFLRRFPNYESLARADHDEVLRYWQGLGYYRRILFLHRAVRQLHDQDMAIPASAVELRKLPGVGDYTAAALSSIAFGQVEAAVDGNVIRVISRLFGVESDVSTSAGRRRIQSLTRQLVSPSRPGDFNQAWMDLGSMVCTPKQPMCSSCPLSADCEAWRQGHPERYPMSGLDRSSKVVSQSHVVAVFMHSGKMLVRRRPVGGLWSGLWEFPNAEVAGAATHGTLLDRLAKEEGIRAPGKPLRMGAVNHRLTHRALELVVYVTKGALARPASEPSRRWVTANGFERISVSTAHRRVYKLVGEAQTNKTA